MKKIVTEYRVPYADTDQMGVVYYGNYMAYFERARNELMRACGYGCSRALRNVFLKRTGTTPSEWRAQHS